MAGNGQLDLDDLRAENAAYHRQMQDLNDTMDRMRLKQEKKGDKAKKPPASAREERPVEIRQLEARNEQLRKERLKWWAEVTHSDTAVRIADTKNEVAALDHQIAQLKEEIRGLENLKKNQQHVVDSARHASDEVKYLHTEHRQELAEFREEFRKLTEENKHSERSLAGWQHKYHGAVEKTKLGLTAAAIEDLTKRVDEQGARIEQMKEQLEDKTASAWDKRKETHRGIDSFRAEKEQLQRQLDAAKQTLLERDRELKLSYARGKLREAGTIQS